MTFARSRSERPEPLLDMDHAATVALCAEARDAMEAFLGPAGDRGTRYGNPSGAHPLARDAMRAVDEARELVAECLGCEPGEVVFTSGGTEADNHAVTGGMPPRPGVPWCSAVEHHAVLAPTRALGGRTVGVDRLGRVDLEELAEQLGAAGQVTLVSVMLANNELGTRNDLHAVAAVLGRCAPGAVLHTDAVQAAAWLDLRRDAAPAHLVSVSAHKLGGPKGVGALVVRDGTAIGPLLHGGGQERGRRGGTHDVAGIVGFAAALRVASGDRAQRCARIAALRDALADAVLADLDGVRETVGPEVAAAVGLRPDRSHLLPGHCHLTIDGVGSEELLLVLEQHGVCAASAASCSSGTQAPSHVLSAIGALDDPPAGTGEVRAALRLSLGVDTTADDVRRTVRALGDAVSRIRSHRRGGTLAGDASGAGGAGS
jgi:cysteine desulfurase